MTTNPYSAPAAPVADPVQGPQGNFVLGGRGVGAGRGWRWIVEGWALFKLHPWTWILIGVVFVLIMLVLGFIPILGPIASWILGPMLSGGLVLGCRSLEQGRGLQFGHLFAGFSERPGSLAGVGAMGLGIFVVIGLIVGATFGFGMAFGGGPASRMELTTTTALIALVFLGLTLPLFMAMWFAPALVVLNERGVIEAMKESFRGCLRNIIPFLVYGLAGLGLSILASIPLGLGWLVLGPVFVASVYASYRDIYFRP